MQIHPDVQEFVETQARDVVHTKTICLQIFSGDVEIAFKRCDAPANGTVGKQGSGILVCDADISHTRELTGCTLPLLQFAIEAV